MASPNTLARNARYAALKPSRDVLVRELPAARTARGLYKQLLTQAARLHNQRNARERVNRNGVRAIPTSGPGRRRAKRHRQQGLCIALVGVGLLCPDAAATGEYCDRHAPKPEDADAAAPSSAV